MCVSSMVMDHYIDKWNPPQPPLIPLPNITTLPYTPPPLVITAEEIREFRKLLERAREYDKRTNQPECEDQTKKRILREIAERFGVTITFPDEDKK